jgi:hypothetical protein
MKNKILLIIVGLVVLISAGAGGYVLASKITEKGIREKLSREFGKDENKDSIGNTPTTLIDAKSEGNAETNENTNPTNNQQQNCISGKISPLSNDLQLFKSDKDSYGGEEPEVKYYDAGTFTCGDFKGYKRLVGVREPLGPGGAESLIFATKDNISYVVGGSQEDAKAYPEDDYRNPLSRVNKSKVTQVADLDSAIHPETITLNQDFILFKKDLVAGYVESGLKDERGYPIYVPRLTTNFTQNPELKFNNSALRFVATNKAKKENFAGTPESEKTINEIENKYINNTTEVIAIDQAGLAFAYSLATTSNLKIYEDKEDLEEYVPTPSLGIESSALETKEKLYKKYEVAFPGACGGSVDMPVISGLADSDLVKVGTLEGRDVYKLTNNSHDLVKLEFAKKIVADAEMFKYGNPGVKKPTFDEYISKTPLLFMKDFWDRTYALGEYDYMLPGGCGKPVVYLYPETPTNVQVRLTSPVNFTAQIPSYHQGWKVKAYPNGKLEDLQPQYTKCSDIDFTHKGAEYAREACETGVYPYIYWSGNMVERSYIEPEKGWIVARKDLSEFFMGKLSEVGLNSNEITDMSDFWLEKMLSENKPYYKVSFLQTAEMNNLAPMEISPKPDTVFRIFLDYKGLEVGELPQQRLESVVLEKLVRRGFTVVEWGGRMY